MKNLLAVLLLLSSSFVAFAQNKTFPEAKIKALDGSEVDLKDTYSKNSYTLISFWATWCGPCKRELDAISELYQSWKTQYGLEVIAVSMDDVRGLAKVPVMVKSKGWEFKVFSDVNSSLSQMLNFKSIPQSYLVDKNGTILYAHSGYSPGDEFEVEDIIKKVKN
jgi:cytochrome c biogenesis protein CcmG, thiol:disulfide interchange protein DsbE